MYDPVTLDQLRAFVCVVEEGSFSAAARKLQRVQSAISTSMSNLESQLGLSIWLRSSKAVKLTDQGQVVLSAARRVLSEVDDLRRLSAGMAVGVEASVSLCLDAFFPLASLVRLCSGFAKEFPAVDLRVETQVMSAVATRVLSGAATLGVISPIGLAPGLDRTALASIRMIPVVGADHPFSTAGVPIPTKRLADSVQIVLSEGGDAGVADQAVLSTRTWRVGDLHTKRALLIAGNGWGNLPEHMVRDDLRRGTLIEIRPEAWAEDEHTLHLSAIYRSDTIFGPAHRWIVKNLEELCVSETRPARAPRASPRSARTAGRTRKRGR